MAPEHKDAAQPASSLDFTAHFGVAEIWARLLGLRTAEAYCKTLPIFDGLAACVDQVLLDHGLQISHIKEAARSIPQNGALLVTANHPTGLLDGTVLLCALLSRRNDIRIVANDLLCNIPVLGDRVIPIKKTIYGDSDGFSALMQVRRAWKRNECVVVFPAGTVAHWQWKSMAIADSPWTTSIQSFSAILKVPEYRALLAVKNPIWFHIFAAFSRRARLAFLLRVFFSNISGHPSHPVAFKLVDDALGMPRGKRPANPS